MRWWTIATALLIAALAGSGCSHDDPLTPPEVDPTGEYRVTTTVVSNTCVEAFACEPICRLWWLAIDEVEQPLYVGRYGSDLVVCPLGPLNASRIVGGTYADGNFVYTSESGIVISSPDPGCRMEQRWSAELSFDGQRFTGEATYDLLVVEGDPAVCSSSSDHYTSLPCRTVYRFDASSCVGCTPTGCDPG